MRKLSLEHVGLIVVTGILLYLFTFHLGYTALTSYDEAWYSQIARNLIISKNPLTLTFNNQIFIDHPPFGYILMALTMAGLGVSEFTARLTSVISGVGCLILLYLLGKKLGGRAVGIGASAVLFSSLWFVIRTRSGNLDVPFLFFEIATVYVLLLKGKRALWLGAFSFAALILTKTLVGFGLLPVIIFIVYTRRKEFKAIEILQALALYFALVLPWYVANQLRDHNFLTHHFIEIGTRGSSNSFALSAILSKTQYLAIGVGKWFKIFLLSLGLAIAGVLKKSTRTKSVTLLVWLLGFVPFLLSSETAVWHLLPLYPPVALCTSFFIFTVLRSIFPKKKFLTYLVVAGFVVLSVFQFHQFSNLVYMPEPVFSVEKNISLKAGKYDTIHLMDTFYPAAVFYSRKPIDALHWDGRAYQKMLALLGSTDDVFIINQQYKSDLERDQIPFVVLESNQSYFLIRRP